jgi:ubiquinone/menaquinone biosynthesis C-methylase UbiE
MDELQQLRAENARLKIEINRLKAQLHQSSNDLNYSNQTNQNLRQIITRFEADLRALQSTNTVRLSRTAGVLARGSRQLISDLRHGPMQGQLDLPAPDSTVSKVLKVIGWASSKAGAVTQVEILLDNDSLGNANYGATRPDVAAVRPLQDDVDCGYTADFTLDSRQTGRKTLLVRVTDSKGNQQEFKQSIVIESPKPEPVQEPVQAIPFRPATPALSDLAVYEAVASRQWFYDFVLPNGQQTHCNIGSEGSRIHSTRLDMLWRALEPIRNGSSSGLTAVDLASHQGFFSTSLAQSGFADVLAVDARQQHVEDCALISRALKLNNIRTMQGDVTKLEPDELGMFDVTLVFGLLYHLEDPVGALRLARAITKKVCVIETQIVPNMTGIVDWGSHLNVYPILGNFGLIDETPETDHPQASITGICLCPSLESLVFIMQKLGFTRIECIPAPQGGHEQLITGKRVVVAGYL